MKTSQRGRDLIIRAEGFRSDAYLCSAGVPTIGFGSTRYLDREPVQLGDTISRADAEELLTHYIATQIDPMIPRLVSRALTQPQWDAFASFLYNFGFEKTRGYTLTQVIANGPQPNSLDGIKTWESELIKWWPRYRMAGGGALLGLYRRRVAELCMFLHLPHEHAWQLEHMGVDLEAYVQNLRGGKAETPQPTLVKPVAPPPEPVTVQEAPEAALTKETPMSDPVEAKPALKSKTIWGVLILVMAPFIAQIGDTLQVAGSTASSTGEAVADITATAMTFIGAILAVIGRMAAGQPLK
jgi:lysozyme